MTKAFLHTAQYDGMIAMTLAHVDVAGGAMRRRAAARSRHEATRKPRTLRYGENPHQTATWYAAMPDETGSELDRAPGQGTVLHQPDRPRRRAPHRAGIHRAGRRGDQAHQSLRRGDGCDDDAAYVGAREADPLSAFGGIVGLNRPIDAATARALTSTFIEAVIAPSIDDEARAILAAKQKLRVVTADFGKAQPYMGQQPADARSFLGGLLVQESDRVEEARDPWPPSPAGADRRRRIRAPRSCRHEAPATEEEWTALRFAWRVCAHVKSNAVIFTAADRTLAVGAGQMSRVDAVKVAVLKAAPGSLTGSVAASDAFFPFRDGLDALAEAGATAVVQPGGSVRDAEVIAAADERGLAMVFTGRRHFRH